MDNADKLETVTVGDGKYTFVMNENGTIHEVLRHGVSWPASDILRHSGVMLALVQDLQEARADRDRRPTQQQYVEDMCSIVKRAEKAKAEFAEARADREWTYVLANDAAKLTLQAEDRAKTAREEVERLQTALHRLLDRFRAALVPDVAQAIREAEARGKAAGLRDAAGELCWSCHLGHKPEERSDAWGWLHKHDDAMGPMPCKASSLLDRAAEIEAEAGDG